MWPVSADDISILRRSDKFDAAWYMSTYPDVEATGMDPAVHYLRYGFRLGRDPGPDFSTRFYQNAFASLVGEAEPLTALTHAQSGAGDSGLQPDPGHVLLGAQRVFATGAHHRALQLAEQYLGADKRHTLNILQANAALAEKDRLGWHEAVNAYLTHYDMEPILLSEGGVDRFHDLAASPARPVEGGPRVSVIMPVRNASDTVEHAIWSVLNQSWKNLEIIAVDDCSMDDSWKVLQKLARKDSRLRVRRLSRNVGPYVARNVALENVTGDWVTCHDSDDWAHPRRLELHMAEALSGATPIRASLTYMVRMQPSGYFDTIVNANPFSPDGVTRISSVSALYEARFLREKLGTWDSVRVGADSEMIARAEAVLGEKIRQFPQIGMICLSTEQGLTRDPVLGVRLKGRLSEARAAYKLSWEAVHMTRPRDQLYLPFPQETRRYQGDFGFDVPHEDILAACRKD